MRNFCIVWLNFFAASQGERRKTMGKSACEEEYDDVTEGEKMAVEGA